jgi:hypothetical protein
VPWPCTDACPVAVNPEGVEPGQHQVTCDAIEGAPIEGPDTDAAVTRATAVPV